MTNSDAPVLTVINLDPSHPQVRVDLSDSCRMHARVLSLLGISPEHPKGRELWATPRPDRLIIQYPRPADVRWLPDGYHTAARHHPVRVDWPEGARVRWALVGNPVRCRSVYRADGTRRGVRVVRHDPIEWARSRLPMLEHHRIEIVDQHTAVGQRPRGQTVTHRRVRYVGVGTVLDPVALAAAIRSGVGPGKAYGCGLLVIGGAA